MKRITAVLKNCKLIDRVFAIREKQIYNALDAAEMNIEQQIADAQIEYEKLFDKLGEKDANYTCIINQLLGKRETIRRGNLTKEALADVRADLEADAEIDEGKEK